MKALTSIGVILCAAATIAGSTSVRADDAKDEKKPCCPATVEGGKSCAHECCVKAAKDGKVCENCHPKKEEKK